MFAGAAREAVFANPEVVRRVNADFIPVALKAALMNNPPGGAEGRLYAELNRTKAAPQGICVANSAGKALAWALSFDDEGSIGKFLDYTQDLYQDSRGAEPVTTERFMRFPGHRLPDVPDSDAVLLTPEGHEGPERCPALPALERGTLVGRIIGRPLDDQGRPIAQTLRQEDYLEARFEIPVPPQEQLARALAATPAGESCAVPRDLARILVSHAYLGQLDVNPLGGRQTGGKTDRESIEFRARRVNGEGPGVTVYLTGTSLVEGGPGAAGVRTDGRLWEHRVQLEWEGYLDLLDNRITRLVLTASGTERLRWGSQRWQLDAEPAVAHLMVGHPIDLDCRVQYGLTAQPAAEEEIGFRQGADSGASRLFHLREAVKHLRAAGVEELADQIARQIQRLEQAPGRDRDSFEK